MKAVVTLPYGYGRAYYDKDRFAKSAPVFDVSVFSDNGNAVQEPYPYKVKMGPDMYNFLSRVMPALAARKGEDLTYEGVVENRRKYRPGFYAYYGYGNRPEAYLGSNYDTGVGLIGYGDTPSPKRSFGKDYSGHDNFLYSVELDSPELNDNESKSKILTNILNDSWDFSPLLAPNYHFTDTKYNAEEDLLGRGPRKTDHWVPRVDKNTGLVVYKEDGVTPQFVPIPLVQDMPIYNLKHPAWGIDPEAAWNMISDPESVMDWRKWDKAPSYADFTGRMARTNKGVIRPRDYLLYNSRIAARDGYFEDYPELKEKAHEKFLDIKGQRSIEKIAEARKEAAKEFARDMKEEQQKLRDEHFFRPDDDKSTGIGKQSNFYKILVHKGLHDPVVLEHYKDSLSADDEKAVKKFVMQPGSFSKYNQYSDDNAKLMAILNDFLKYKEDSNRHSNIISGVKEAF